MIIFADSAPLEDLKRLTRNVKHCFHDARHIVSHFTYSTNEPEELVLLVEILRV